jgi:uncharacterized protein (DUF697 family)
VRVCGLWVDLAHPTCHNHSMAGFNTLFNIWKNLKEVDLRPIRESALRPVRLAIVGRPGVGRHSLAEQMRRDPQRPEQITHTALLISDLDAADQAAAAEVIILMLDATAQDFRQEQAAAKQWSDSGKKVMALVNKVDLLEDRRLKASSKGWPVEAVLYGSVLSLVFLQREFIPVMLDLLPERHLALGRQFPLFRGPIAQDLINETCFINTAYSFGMGLAEIVPVFDIPMNIADTVVLTKAQAFLVYKLGLALGFSTRWQEYLAEFGSVIGGGFVWRQVARLLVGLIPIWGIVPQAAVAYAGTYVVGHVVLQWYQTGRHITKEQMNTIYKNGLLKGKKTAQRMFSWLPRSRAGKRKNLSQAPVVKNCPFCQKPNAADAKFCQYCGKAFI